MKQYAKASFLTNIVCTVVLAVIVTLMLEGFNRGSLVSAFGYLLMHPVLFLTNLTIITLTFLPTLLVKKRLPLIFIVLAVWLTLGISNGIVLSYRAAPLSAIDFLVVKSMFGMATIYFSVGQLILIFAATVLFITALVMLLAKSPRCNVYRKNTVVTLAVSVGVFVFLRLLAAPITTDGYESGKLADAYRHYGFAYCFSHSLLSQGVDRPDDYKSGDADEIMSQVGDVDSTQEEQIPLVKPNIVMVQLESFFDVNYIKDISYSQNPVPNLTELKENGISGLLRVPHLGGGTSNVEFEVLTGMNLDHFGFGEYPYTTVLKTKSCESLAANLKTLGYSTHALHNHIATFYDRNLAYSSLGFDTFTPIELMTNITRNPLGWAKDTVLIEEITSALDSTDSLDFVFAVSVQAHGKYPDEPIDTVSEYASLPEGSDVCTDIKVYNIDDRTVHSKFEYYVNQIYEMDAFVGELISTLEERDEPTVVVLYGDHLPSLPMRENDLITGDLYLTEYVIWSNIALGGLSEDEANSLDTDLEAYRLSSYLQHLCGMNVGDITRLHQYELKTGDYRDGDLKTLTYTQLYDDGEIEYIPTDMAYGTRDVTINSCAKVDNTLVITGSNFNEYSTVKIDGFGKKAVYVDENTLLVENVIFSAKEVQVIQETVDGTQLASAKIQLE